MKLKFVFLALLLVSTTLAQDYTKQAACIRDTLGKLSQAGRIHAFGIRVTNESSIAVDSFKVGGNYSALTSKLVDDGKNSKIDPTLNPVNATINLQNRTYSYVDLLLLEKDPTIKTVDGVAKADLVTLEKQLEQEAQAQKETQTGNNTAAVKSEEGQATKSELTEAIQNLDVAVKKLENKGLTINTTSENATAQMKEILTPPTNSTSDIPEESKDQIVIINGQRLIKKFAAQTSVLQEQIKEETQAVQTLEDKLRLVTDSKEAETIKNELKKLQLQIEKLEEKKANITSTIRVVNQTVTIANQTINQIKQEIQQATLEEIKKFGTKCTSFSIRPSVKFCTKWRTTEDSKVCDQWKDIYRGSKCLKQDAAGKCIDLQYFFDEKVDRYECESHSLEFPKEHCMKWEAKNGQAICIKNETFYQAQTCVEFVLVGKEMKCGRYEGAYPAFRCVKTMMVDGKQVCQEMGAYTPHYYCKEYMMVDEHRYCKKRELFFGTHTVQFECEEKEKIKDANTGEVHCLKFTAKKLDQFKDFKVQPISDKTINLIDKATKQVETEVKKIDKKIITETAEVERIEKKIKELEKNMNKMSTTTDVTTIKKIIEAEKKKAEVIKHHIAVEKEIKDKIKSAETTVERRKVQIQGEIRDSRGRIVVEAEILKKCDRTIKEAKDKLRHEKDPSTIEKIKRIITEESDKKRKCEVTITTIKQDIDKKEKQIKETKVDIKTIEAKIKENEIKELIKHQTKEIKDKKEQLKIIKDAIKNTKDLEKRDALVKNYTIITEQIKIIKHDIKHEIKDIKKIITQEIITIKQKTETTVEDLKKRLYILEITITKLEEIKKKITTHEEKIKIIEIIKKKIEEITEIRKKIITINHESKVIIEKLREEKTPPKKDNYRPPVLPTIIVINKTTPIVPEESTCIKRTTIDVPITLPEGFDIDETHEIQVEINQKASCVNQEQTVIIDKHKTETTVVDERRHTSTEETSTTHHKNESNTTIKKETNTEVIVTPPRTEESTCIKNSSYTSDVDVPVELDNDRSVEVEITNQKSCVTDAQVTRHQQETSTHTVTETTTHNSGNQITTIKKETTSSTDVPKIKEKESTCIKTSNIDVPLPRDFKIDTKQTKITIEGNGQRTSEDGKIRITVNDRKECATPETRRPITTIVTENKNPIRIPVPVPTRPTERGETTQRTTEERRYRQENSCIKTSSIDIPIAANFEVDANRRIDVDVNDKKSCVAENRRRSIESSQATIIRRDTRIRESSTRPTRINTAITRVERTEERRPVRSEERRPTRVEERRPTRVEERRPTRVEVRQSEQREERRPVRVIERTEKKRRGQTCRKDSKIDIPVETDMTFKEGGSYYVTPGSKKYFKKSGLEVQVLENKSYENERVAQLRRQMKNKLRKTHRMRTTRINRLTLEHIRERLNRLIQREETEIRILRKNGNQRLVNRENRQLQKYRRLFDRFNRFECNENSCYKNTHFLNQIERKLKNIQRSNSIRSRRSIRRRASLERVCNRQFYRSTRRRQPTHIRSASSNRGRGLQSVTPANSDISLVKTFQDNISTFRPADRALINSCFV
jgi:predicted  nucleic acid-binding Zn-ribbon protein